MTEQKRIWPVIVTGDYPKIISSPGRGEVTAQIREGLDDDKTRTAVAQEMLRTVLYERAPTMRKAMSRLK